MATTVDWDAVDKVIPQNCTPDGQKARQEIFDSFDPNGNGLLTLTEVQGGLPNLVNELCGLKRDYRPAVKAAFMAARDIHSEGKKKSKKKSDNDICVDRTEFHALLVAFRHYVEMDVMFDAIDKDGTRMLNWKELEKALPKMKDWNLGKSKDVKSRWFKDDWTESLKYEDFADWAINKKLGGLNLQLDGNDAFQSLQENVDKSAGMGQTGKLLEAFKTWDTSGDGKITVDELFSVMSQLDSTFTKDQADILFKAADANADGNIDYSEFAKWITQ